MKYITLVLIVLTGTQLARAGDIQYDIRVDGITCPFCVATSVKALKKIDGVHTVGSDLDAGTIIVCADSSVTFTNEQLQQLFLDKGFTFRSFEQKAQCTIDSHSHEGAELENIPEDHTRHHDRTS